jgi:hypothetical protein
MNRLALLLAVLALPTLAAADQRAYAFTYQPITAAKGGLDLELYGTYYDPPAGSASPRLWRHQLELEYGITDRWDVALYNVFRRPYGGELEYEGFKVRTRFRATEPGLSPVDVVLYLEVEKELVDDEPTKIEEKLLLGRDFGRANVALDLIAEQEFAGGETELEWGYSVGASWELHPRLRIGAESFGDLKEAAGATGNEWELEAWAGPAVSVALPVQAGVLHGSWFTVTAGFGLNDESDDLRLRGILAFQF